MSEPVHPSPTPSDNDRQHYRLSIESVVGLLAKADFPRTYRTIQRYCESHRLDCKQEDTTSGKQYFVTEASVDRLIGELRQFAALKDMSSHAQADLGEPRHVQTDENGSTASATSPDTASQAQTSPDMSSPDQVGEEKERETRAEFSPDGSFMKYVERLEHDVERLEVENDTKNALIASLVDRNRETNTLIQGLQRILTPLLSGPQPQRSGRTEVPSHVPQRQETVEQTSKSGDDDVTGSHVSTHNDQAMS